MRAPTIFFVVQRDQICALMFRAVLAIWFAWLAFGFVYYLGGDSAKVIVEYAAPKLFWAASVSSVIGLPLVLWRAMMIRFVFRTGQTTSAVVTSVLGRQGIYQVWYKYQWDGRALVGRNMVKGKGRVTKLKAGDALQLSVLPHKPNRSFAWELFS